MYIDQNYIVWNWARGLHLGVGVGACPPWKLKLLHYRPTHCVTACDTPNKELLTLQYNNRSQVIQQSYSISIQMVIPEWVAFIYLKHTRGVWPNPGRSRRVGNHYHVRICVTADMLQPNQIVVFKWWRRGLLMNEPVSSKNCLSQIKM